MASPAELDLVTHDAAAAKRGAPDLMASGSFAARSTKDRDVARVLPVDAAADGDGGGGEPASPGAVAPASLVHAAGLRHGVAEVMAVSPGGDRILLRRRPADDPLAPDTWDVSARAHLLPEDGGDAASAARRALREAGLGTTGLGGVALEPAAGGPEHRRLEFKVGACVENVVVHSFVARLAAEDERKAKADGAAGDAGGDAAAKPAPANAAAAEERVWLDKGAALAMLEGDPAVCSPFLAAGKKVWFG